MTPVYAVDRDLGDELGFAGEGSPQGGVGAPRGEQFGVGPGFGDAALVQDYDAVRAGGGGQAVRDYDGGARRGQLDDWVVHRRIGGQVEVCGGGGRRPARTERWRGQPAAPGPAR